LEFLMKKMEECKTINISYTIKDEDGVVVEKTLPKETLTVVIGRGDVFPEVEVQLKAVKMGDFKKFQLEPSGAYGEYHESKVTTVYRSDEYDLKNPKKGQKINYLDKNDDVQQCKIIDIKDDFFVIDFNHPLAGKRLTYELFVNEVYPLQSRHTH
jgi:FKBP-type peptidyl-prolyl cis-trans isomerase 2